MSTERLDRILVILGRRVDFYLFLAALTIHVCYLCQYGRTPFFWAPELDSLFDDLTAKAIVAGHISHDPFFRAPLYLYFLAAVYKIAGHSYWAARLTQAVIGSTSVVLLYRLGCRLMTPSIAVVAAAGMALYGPLIYNDGELHTPVLEVFLDLAILLTAAAAARRAGSVVTSPQDCALGGRVRSCVLCGLVMGLSAITRPTILITIPVIAWWIVWQDRRRWAALCAAFLIGSALLPTLVTVRNWRVSGDPVFIASQGGINLYLGNRPNADGFTPSTPSRYRFDDEYEDSVALYGQRAAEDAAGHQLTASQAQSYWVRRSLDWWRVDPSAALRLTGRKVVLAWTHHEIRNNTAYDFVIKELTPFLRVCFIGFWIVGPLGLLGMVLAVVDAVRPYRSTDVPACLFGPLLLTAFVLVYLAGVVPFFMADRYRLPIVPALLLLASFAAFRLIEIVRAHHVRGGAPALAVLLAAAVFVNVDWVHTSNAKTWAIDYWSEGNRYVRMGRPEKAVEPYLTALKLDPSNGDIWNGLGEALYDQGRLAEAAACFRRSAATGPDVSRADYNEAICLEQTGDRRSARDLLTVAIAIDPTYDRARVELAHLDDQ